MFCISANRIHISVSTNNLLMKLRGFTTERRGLVEVKVYCVDICTKLHTWTFALS